MFASDIGSMDTIRNGAKADRRAVRLTLTCLPNDMFFTSVQRTATVCGMTKEQR
jgi:hypothetical protein